MLPQSLFQICRVPQTAFMQSHLSAFVCAMSDAKKKSILHLLFTDNPYLFVYQDSSKEPSLRVQTWVTGPPLCGPIVHRAYLNCIRVHLTTAALHMSLSYTILRVSWGMGSDFCCGHQLHLCAQNHSFHCGSATALFYVILLRLGLRVLCLPVSSRLSPVTQAWQPLVPYPLDNNDRSKHSPYNA